MEIIKSPLVPFYTLVIDFIFNLPLNKAKKNYIIIIIYKFSKLITLLINKIIFFIKD